MKTSEIRQKFLDFFNNKHHDIVTSSSLVPGNDPTLLFTNAGMVQFKEVFLGDEHRDVPRAVTSQRCVRAGGKHNDLENVGYTARHHTFFEMLGNFSFGDYFKQEAISYAWELLTDEFGLEKEKLWITVFEEDDEAEDIWINQIGVPVERVTRIGAKDNFWSMGDTGPCGPCSEIFYDHGEEVAGGPPGTPEEDGDRFVEIWNLVFMQFNRTADGTLHPLPKPSVDTGMGLERIAAVLQGVHNNYEIDLFQNLIQSTANILNVPDTDNKSLRVIADHLRSAAFLIVDGVTPSNEGRGYVLRRIIRRAIRHGYQLGAVTPFMNQLVSTLVSEMGDAFPELKKAQKLVEKVLLNENEKFNETLDQGLKILDSVIENLEAPIIPGETVFKLYDTFGFPVDLTADVAREKGLAIDQTGFDHAMEAQRNRGRAASQFIQSDQIRIDGLEATPFLGYQTLTHKGRILGLVQEDTPVEKIESGKGLVILDETPFYAESGGQVGDNGIITGQNFHFNVETTYYISNKVIAHYGELETGCISISDIAEAKVENNTRNNNANNHSATHLLHAALIEQLGEHVQQKGSLVEAKRLRFDFSHFEPVTASELSLIERLVNSAIRRNAEVTTRQMNIDEAKAEGAAALFGEKYGESVRVVKMEDLSLELCGGTHVERTGNIGCFKIISETGIAAGVRRIEAVTGSYAEDFVDAQLDLVNQMAVALKTTPQQLNQKLNAVLSKQLEFQKQIKTLQLKLVSNDNDDQAILSDIGDIKVIAIRQDESDIPTMRTTLDQYKSKHTRSVILVIGENEEKVSMVAGVSTELSKQLSAGALIKSLSPHVDGRGGGKNEFAQGGGSNPDGIKSAIDSLPEWVSKTIS